MYSIVTAQDATKRELGNDWGDYPKWEGFGSGRSALKVHCSHLQGHSAVILSLFSIIIPAANLKDLDKIETELRKKVQFYPVNSIGDVLNIAFPGVLEKHTPKL